MLNQSTLLHADIYHSIFKQTAKVRWRPAYDIAIEIGHHHDIKLLGPGDQLHRRVVNNHLVEFCTNSTDIPSRDKVTLTWTTTWMRNFPSFNTEKTARWMRKRNFTSFNTEKTATWMRKRNFPSFNTEKAATRTRKRNFASFNTEKTATWMRGRNFPGFNTEKAAPWMRKRNFTSFNTEKTETWMRKRNCPSFNTEKTALWMRRRNFPSTLWRPSSSLL